MQITTKDFSLENLAVTFRRRSFFIKTLKFLFPLCAVALSAVLIFFPASGKKKKEITIEYQKTTPNELPAMINPRYSGLDSQNQPYSISAKKAYQPAEKLVELEDVAADITLKNGNWLSLVAPKGTYEIDEQFLTLPAAYDLFITEPSAKTYQASGTELSVDAKKSIAKSNKKFMAESEQFVLTSQNGFTFYKAESRILFHGRVNLVIYKK